MKGKLIRAYLFPCICHTSLVKPFHQHSSPLMLKTFSFHDFCELAIELSQSITFGEDSVLAQKFQTIPLLWIAKHLKSSFSWERENFPFQSISLLLTPFLPSPLQFSFLKSTNSIWLPTQITALKGLLPVTRMNTHYLNPMDMSLCSPFLPSHMYP